MSNRELFLRRANLTDIKFVMRRLSEPGCKIYLPVLVEGLASNMALYFENDDNDVYTGVCRVFMSIQDANKYLSWLADNGFSDPQTLKAYQVSVDKAVDQAVQLSLKTAKPLKFVVSTFYDDEIIEISTFWDGLPN